MIVSRANGALDTSPAQCPGIVPRLAIRPAGAEYPCAPIGRATFVCSRDPGRCPGLASAGAFSAGKFGSAGIRPPLHKPTPQG
jgi:hypothetical protein